MHLSTTASIGNLLFHYFLKLFSCSTTFLIPNPTLKFLIFPSTCIYIYKHLLGDFKITADYLLAVLGVTRYVILLLLR